MNAKNETPEALAVLDAVIVDYDHLLPSVAGRVRKARDALTNLYIQANLSRMLLRDMADAGFGDKGPSDDLRKALAAVEKLS